MLNWEWAWWYDRRQSTQRMQGNAYENSLNQVGSVRTAREFFQYFNNMCDPGDMQPGTTMYFFRHDVKPMWEDPANGRGASLTWRVTGPSKEVAKKWEMALLALIGETILDTPSGEIVGILFARRAKGDRIAIWIRDKSNAMTAANITLFFKNELMLGEPAYEPHPIADKKPSGRR